MHPNDDPGHDSADPADVEADDQYVEDIRHDRGDPDADMAAAWRHEVRSAPLPPISGWVEDRTSPSGWAWLPDLTQVPQMASPTGLMPAVRATAPVLTPAPILLRFEHSDGSTYVRAHPGEFPAYDEVDSRRVVDPGAPI